MPDKYRCLFAICSYPERVYSEFIASLYRRNAETVPAQYGNGKVVDKKTVCKCIGGDNIAWSGVAAIVPLIMTNDLGRIVFYGNIYNNSVCRRM